MLDEGRTDLEWLERAAAGEREAFGPLVTRHQDSLFRFVSRMGASDAQAEDLLQETFIAAFNKASQFRREGSVRGWLFSIARNVMRQSMRRRSEEPSTSDSLEVLGQAAGWGSDPPIDFEERLGQREILERAIAELDEEERAVLLLRDVEGLSGEEAARVLEVGVPAMKSRLHRARLRLAALVRQGGYDGS